MSMRENNKKFDEMQERWHHKLQEMAGGQATDGLEMVNLMRMTLHFIDAKVNQNPLLSDLSGPRMGILMRLLADEDFGNHEGLNPTLLSHYQNVKKNTVSSLLSGLEEQGMIERTINPEDKRGFNIRLTAVGRERIIASMPERFNCINQITSGLNSEEKQQMIKLLGKLRTSLLASHHNNENCTPGQPPTSKGI
jgi:DNA-binding MarR family transcriptional regulator